MRSKKLKPTAMRVIFGGILPMVATIVTTCCSAYVEHLQVVERNDYYEFGAFVNTNRDYFKGRESFLKGKRDSIYIDIPKKRGPVSFNEIRYGVDTHPEYRAVAGSVEVFKIDEKMHLIIKLTGPDGKPLPYNGDYWSISKDEWNPPGCDGRYVWTFVDKR